MDYTDYTEWFYQRLTQLRMERGVSARDMSLSLGQSESYINKIENRRTMPSMTGFFYICEFFGLTPQEFFDTGVTSPKRTRELQHAFGKLTPQQAEHVLQIVKDITQR